MTRLPPPNQETKDTIVGLRDAGHSWDFIAARVGRNARSCYLTYGAVKRAQRHLKLEVNNPTVKADYSGADYGGRD